MGILITHDDRALIDRDTVVIYDHIPKCAGMSFASWLSGRHKDSLFRYDAIDRHP